MRDLLSRWKTYVEGRSCVHDSIHTFHGLVEGVVLFDVRDNDEGELGFRVLEQVLEVGALESKECRLSRVILGYRASLRLTLAGDRTGRITKMNKFKFMIKLRR